MKRIHISRKKAILITSIAAVSLVAATFIPKVVRAHSRRKYASV